MRQNLEIAPAKTGRKRSSPEDPPLHSVGEEREDPDLPLGKRAKATGPALAASSSIPPQPKLPEHQQPVPVPSTTMTLAPQQVQSLQTHLRQQQQQPMMQLVPPGQQQQQLQQLQQPMMQLDSNNLMHFISAQNQAGQDPATRRLLPPLQPQQPQQPQQQLLLPSLPPPPPPTSVSSSSSGSPQNLAASASASQSLSTPLGVVRPQPSFPAPLPSFSSLATATPQHSFSPYPPAYPFPSPYSAPQPFSAASPLPSFTFPLSQTAAYRPFYPPVSGSSLPLSPLAQSPTPYLAPTPQPILFVPPPTTMGASLNSFVPERASSGGLSLSDESIHKRPQWNPELEKMSLQREEEEKKQRQQQQQQQPMQQQLQQEKLQQEDLQKFKALQQQQLQLQQLLQGGGVNGGERAEDLRLPLQSDDPTIESLMRPLPIGAPLKAFSPVESLEFLLQQQNMIRSNASQVDVEHLWGQNLDMKLKLNSILEKVFGNPTGKRQGR